MLQKIKQMDNKLIQAQLLAYLISNKKVSKILKSSYIKYFNELFEELPKYYYTHQYNIDLKSFFNNETTNNNIIPNFISTSDYVNYTTTLNYTIKNKHLVESILKSYDISVNDENFKNMKKVLSGKFDKFEFTTIYEENVIVEHSELQDRDISQKNFKEVFEFELPNTITTETLESYPLVFAHVSTNNSIMQFSIFSEENINTIEHYTLLKNKINKLLNS